MHVTDPDGVEWEVCRDWLEVPRWWKQGEVEGGGVFDAACFPDFDADLGIVGFLVVVAILVLLLLGGWVLLVMLAAVLVAIGGLLVRILFRRPWLVTARSAQAERRWRVRGTLGSRRAMHDIASALRRGDHDFAPREPS